MLTLHLSSDAEARLRRQAEAVGQDLESYASRLLEQATARAALDELLAPLRRHFSESGTADDALVQQITEAQAAYRAEKKTA